MDLTRSRVRRLALTTCLRTAALATSAQAAIVPSANDPNTTVPNSFTDATGLELGLCTNAGCLGERPNLAVAPSVPGNFNEGGEAFWYIANADLSNGSAEFAVEAAFEDLVPNGGGAFTRQRFRFDNLSGTVRLTTPYGSKIYTDLTPGVRSINDTVDLGLVGGCVVGPCAYAGANYGEELTTFLRPVGWTPGAPGTVTSASVQ